MYYLYKCEGGIRKYISDIDGCGNLTHTKDKSKAITFDTGFCAWWFSDLGYMVESETNNEVL